MTLAEWGESIAKRCKVPKGRQFKRVVVGDTVEFVVSKGNKEARVIISPYLWGDGEAVRAVQDLLECPA